TCSTLLLLSLQSAARFLALDRAGAGGACFLLSLEGAAAGAVNLGSVLLVRRDFSIFYRLKIENCILHSSPFALTRAVDRYLSQAAVIRHGSVRSSLGLHR